MGFYKTKESVLEWKDDWHLEGNMIPHCDSRVLHAPGECDYCDKYPRAQAERMKARICFTGKTPEHMAILAGGRATLWDPCPADQARPPQTSADHRRWAGNKPTSAKGEPSWPTETVASAMFYGDQGGRAPWPKKEVVRRRTLRPLNNLGYWLQGYQTMDGLRVFDVRSRHRFGKAGKCIGQWLIRLK